MIPQPDPTAAAALSTTRGKVGVLVKRRTVGRLGVEPLAQKKTTGRLQDTREDKDGNRKTNKPGSNDTTEQNQPCTSTDASASGSHSGVWSCLDSAVSQFPPLSGIPESFEGLSGIGGQYELA